MLAARRAMKIILTNDDGFDQPGIATLERLCRPLADELVVVAPAVPQNGISHRLTDEGEIRVERRGEGRWAVHGTPADCARIALHELAPGADWLVSGINAGANLGMDTHVSGTVAAAREAAILGVQSLAISQYRRRFAEIDWERSGRRAVPVLRRALACAAGPGTFWNANLPHPPDEAVDCEIVECPLDTNPGSVRFESTGSGFHSRGDYHARPRSPGHDVDVCFGGRVALTLLRLAPR